MSSSQDNNVCPPEAKKDKKIDEDKDIEYNDKVFGTNETLREWSNILASNYDAADVDILSAVEEYPTPYIFANMALKAYNVKQRNDLTEWNGWKLLTTATNKTNGYAGRAYYNLKKQQIVIAHCGTKFGLHLDFLKDLDADLNGIMLNKYVGQMNSACTFTYHIISVLKEINENPNKLYFQLFFTGHSLGGWLAQITTFSAKYLTIIEGTFQRIKEVRQEGFHAHTVVFDSPGCKMMLDDMHGTYFIRYDDKNRWPVDNLDISSYLSAPNRINTCNAHVGKLYRIFVDLSDLQLNFGIEWFKDWYQYNLKTHSIERILKVFPSDSDSDSDSGQDHTNKQNKSKILEVLDWPICGLFGSDEEYKTFFEWGKKLNNYHYDSILEKFSTKRVSYCPIRYQTKPFNKNECCINVFTQTEQEFLQGYIWLREFNAFFNLNKYFEELCKDLSSDISKKLGNFKVRSYKESSYKEVRFISCDSAENLKVMIPYTKRLLQLFPGMLEKVKEELGVESVRNKLYEHVSKECFNQMDIKTDHFSCNDVIGLNSFLNHNKQQLFQITANKANTLISLSKVYNILNKDENIKVYYKNQNNHTILTLDRLLSVNQLINLRDFFESKKNHLLIVECKLRNVNTENAKEFFSSLPNFLTIEPSNKIILITEGDEIFINEQENMIDKEIFIKTQDKRLELSDLTVEAQIEILEKNIFLFQGQKTLTNLKQLVGIDPFDQRWSQIVDEEMLAMLISGKEKNITIGRIPARLSDSKAAYSKLCEKIEGKENFMNCLCKMLKDNRENSEPIFIISLIKQETVDENYFMTYLGIEENSENGKEIVNALKDKKVIINGLINENQFKELCSTEINRSKRIYWLKVASEEIFYLQQLYDPIFYFNRELQYQKKIFIKRSLLNNQESLIIIKTREGFINLQDQGFENIDQEIILVNSSTETVVSVDEAKNIFQNLSRQKVHLLQDEQDELVWQCSYGSLGLLSKDQISKEEYSLLTEDEFIQEFHNKAAIIIDEPGMGKSTTLTKLSEQILESNWVIRISFIDCQDAIESIPSQNLTTDEVVKFLSSTSDKDVGLNKPFEKKILKYKLENADEGMPLFLLFDGFDEIKDKNGKDKVCLLLKYLKDKATILVTARQHEAEILKNSLLVFDTQLAKLTEEKQKDFLQNFWKHRISLTLNQDQNVSHLYFDQKFTEFSGVLFKRIKEIFTEENAHFIGIPLQLRLLAEGFRNVFATFIKDDGASNPLDFSNFDLISIYKSFIDAKYNIYYKEKTNVSVGLNNVLEGWLRKEATKQHMRLAFNEVFADRYNNFFGVKPPFLKRNENSKLKINNDQLLELLRIGIIQSTGVDNYKFIHRTFAEYYIAELLANWLKRPTEHHKNPQIKIFLLEEILLKSDYQFIRTLFNGHLENGSIPEETLAEWGKYIMSQVVQKGYIKKRKLYSKTVLHVAAEENNNKIVDLLLNSLKGEQKVLASFISQRNMFAKTALYIAVEKRHTKIVKQLLDSVKSCADSIQKILQETILRSGCSNHDENKKFVFYNDCCYYDANTTFLEKFIQENYADMLPICENIKEKCQLITPFLNAVKYSNKDEVKNILDKEDKNIQHFLIFCTAGQTSEADNQSAYGIAKSKNDYEIIELFENYLLSHSFI